MTTLIIKDNTVTAQADFHGVSLLTKRIADKTLNQLGKEGLFIFPVDMQQSDDLSPEQLILQSYNQNYRSSNVMGFLGMDKEQLFIQSRFSTNKQDYFFQYVLEKTLDIPNITDLNSYSSPSERIFDLYVFLFPFYLKRAMRKGQFKTYVWQNYNNQNIKGIIDVKRQVQLNTPFVGNIAFKQREFSFDNYMTQLIRHTIEFIKLKSFGKILLNKITDEIDKNIEVTSTYQYFDRKKVIIDNKTNPIRHAYYQEYRDLQRLCLMILQYDKHNIGLGSDHINGILFDGAWLWEEYIAKLIGDKFHHPKNRLGSGAQQLFSTEDGHKRGRIYPDFISKNTEKRIIVDTKYKPLNNIGNKDYLQVLAYMFRFNAKIGFYIYPERDDSENSELKMFLNQGTTFDNDIIKQQGISLTKLGLQIPNSQNLSYSEFVQAIRISESKIVERLINSK